MLSSPTNQVSPEKPPYPPTLPLGDHSSDSRRQDDDNEEIYQLSVRAEEEEQQITEVVESFAGSIPQTIEDFRTKWRNQAEARVQIQTESKRKRTQRLQRLERARKANVKLAKAGARAKVMGQLKRVSVVRPDEADLVYEDEKDEKVKEGCFKKINKAIMKKVADITRRVTYMLSRYPVIVALIAYAQVALGRLLFLYDWGSDCYVTYILYGRMIDEHEALQNGTGFDGCGQAGAAEVLNTTLSSASNVSRVLARGEGPSKGAEGPSKGAECNVMQVAGVPMFYPAVLFLVLPYIACWIGLIAYHQNEITADAKRKGVKASTGARLNSLLYQLCTGLPSLVLRDIYVCIFCVFKDFESGSDEDEMLRFYWMLRSAAECFLESLPQCGLQVMIYLELRREGGDEAAEKILLASVAGSFVTAVMHIKKISDGAKNMEAYQALFDEQEQALALWLTGTDAKESAACLTHKGRRGKKIPMLKEKGGKLYSFCPKRGEVYRPVVAQKLTENGGIGYAKKVADLRIEATALYRVRVGTSLLPLSDMQAKMILRWSAGLPDHDPKKMEKARKKGKKGNKGGAVEEEEEAKTYYISDTERLLEENGKLFYINDRGSKMQQIVVRRMEHHITAYERDRRAGESIRKSRNGVTKEIDQVGHSKQRHEYETSLEDLKEHCTYIFRIRVVEGFFMYLSHMLTFGSDTVAHLEGIRQGKLESAMYDATHDSGMLTDKELMYLAAAIEKARTKGRSKLKLLCLPCNYFCVNGASEGLEELLKVISIDKVLLALVMNSNFMGPAGATMMADLVRQDSCMRKLNVSDNELGGVYFESNEELEGYNSWQLGADHRIGPACDLCAGLRWNHALVHLNLSENGLGAAVFEVLAKSIAHHPSLMYLNLAANMASSNSETAKQQVLTETEADANSVVFSGFWQAWGYWESRGAADESGMHGKVAGFGVDMVGVKAFAFALRSNTALTYLDLADNDLTASGADLSGVEALSQALKGHRSLEVVDLRENDCDDWYSVENWPNYNPDMDLEVACVLNDADAEKHAELMLKLQERADRACGVAPDQLSTIVGAEMKKKLKHIQSKAAGVADKAKKAIVDGAARRRSSAGRHESRGGKVVPDEGGADKNKEGERLQQPSPHASPTKSSTANPVTGPTISPIASPATSPSADTTATTDVEAAYDRKLEEKITKKIRKIFSEMDENSDGRLTKDEMMQFYGRSGADLTNEVVKQQMDAQWAKVDLNNDGSVSLEEFIQLQMPIMKKATRAHQKQRQLAKQRAAPPRGTQ
jgi:hypothetical protein